MFYNYYNTCECTFLFKKLLYSLIQYFLPLFSPSYLVWEAKTYTLAILIAFFSGGWPYVKMMALLLSFILPPDVLSRSTRQIMLRVMDVLGKWSLMDCFVMIIFSCAFYFQIAVEGMGVYVTVKSEWGFYSYIMAILNSLGTVLTVVVYLLLL